MQLGKSFQSSAMPEPMVWGAHDVTSAKGDTDENFPVGSLLFAKRNRHIILAYYRFARAIDDIADNAQLSSVEKELRLGGMEAILKGEQEPPPRKDAQTAARLRQYLLKSDVPFETATDLLVAFRQDAVKKRYKTWEELLRYCRYSANPVGRFLLLLHGESEQTLPSSDALCSALQILNHLQDVTSDFEKLDRSYLPENFLLEAGADAEDVCLARTKPSLRRVFDRLLDEVDDLNRQATELPRLVRDRRLRAYTAVVVNVSQRLACRLRRQDPVLERVELSRLDKTLTFVEGLRSLAV